MLVNALLLAIWVVMVDLWLARHFHSGVGVTEILVLVGVPLSGALFTGIIDFFIDKDAQTTYKDYLSGFIKRQLTLRVIICLYLGAGAVAMVYTTLSIVPVASDKLRNVTLSKLDHTVVSQVNKAQVNKPLALHLLINPFANQYRLSVGGYLPKVISIRPFFGTTIIVERDLLPIPTILFRPAGYSNGMLGNGGWFELYRKNMSGTFERLAQQQGRYSWFTGPRRNQPIELRKEWRLEAIVQGYQEKAIATLLLNWRHPKLLNLAVDIGPGQTVCALVASVERKKYFSGVATKILPAEYIDLQIVDFIQGDSSDETNIDYGSANAVCHWLSQGAGARKKPD